MLLDRKSRVRPLVVMKFGGTSVGSVERIRHVAGLAIAAQKAGSDVVLVVSAMSGETNRLLALGEALADNPDRREKDALAATGEQASAALTAIAIMNAGGKARSFLGHQMRILTDASYGDARIRSVDTASLASSLERGEIPVVAGFQGVDSDGSITTLGRGGSDTTAVAVAAALGAACEIYTDVDGVYTGDPRICPKARKMSRLPYGPMLTLASLGAKVLHDRCVEMARDFKVPVHLRTSFGDVEGTWIADDEEEKSGAARALGIAADKNLVRGFVALLDLAPATSALARGGVSIKGVFRDATPAWFVAKASDVVAAKSILAAEKLMQVRFEDVASISLVGSGFTAEAAMKDEAAALLAEHSIKLLRHTITDTSMTLLVPRESAEEALRVLHDGLVLGERTGIQARVIG